MKDKYDQWEKYTREEVKKVENEDKEGKEQSDVACGLQEGPTGLPTQRSKEQRNEQASAQQARNEVINKMKDIEKTVSSPESGDIEAGSRGLRIENAGSVTLNIVNHPIKVFIDKCNGTTVKILEQIVTSSLEIYESDGLTVELGTAVATIQCDSVTNTVLYLSHEDMVSIIHDNCTNLTVHAGGNTHVLVGEKPTVGQYVSRWKENAFITFPLVRNEEKFPINVTDPSATPGATEQTRNDAIKLKDEGNAAFQASDFIQAAAYYSQSLAEEETDVVYCNRSACWLKMGQVEKALDDARRAEELNAKNAKAFFRQGIALHALERFSEAIPVLSKAEDLDPKNTQIKDAIRMAQLKARQQAQAQS